MSISSNPLTPRSDQLVGVRFLQQAGRAILADEPGVGKSCQALLAAEGRTLVVSPALLSDVWTTERALWRPELDMTWVSYNSLCASERTAKGGTARLPIPAAEYRGRWDTVIFDEAHALKGRHTLWADAGELVAKDAQRVFMLTGTPLPNWSFEIFRLLKLLYPEEAIAGRRLGSFWRWAEEWFKISMGAKKRGGPPVRDIGDLLPHLTWEQFARDNGLQQRWLRRTLEETAGLPPVREQTITLDMGEAQAKVYKRLKKESYARIEETGNEIVSWTEGGIWTKLLKLTTGIPVEDPAATINATNSSKLAALVEVMAERIRPTLVFTLFRSSAERAAEALRKAGHSVAVISGAYPMAERQQAIRTFQAGATPVLVGTIATMAEGITLTEADCVIFLERDPRPSKRQQAIRRIQRTGQTRPCLVIDLVIRRSVDSLLLELIGTKTDQQVAALRAFDLLQHLDP